MYALGPKTTFIARLERGMANEKVPCAALTLEIYPIDGFLIFFILPLIGGNQSTINNKKIHIYPTKKIYKA
jgi:hypothetical protein